MKHTEYAYAAGYLDGEGCFKFHHGTPVVSITSTYVHTLLWFKKMFGGSTRAKKKQDNPNFRQAHYWEISGDNARSCIKNVLPYLQEKTTQAKILLEISSYPPRSHRRTQLEQELRDLKRINYEWKHSNTTPHQNSSQSFKGDSMTPSSSAPPK